ncbi:hypothetical protein Dxin01_02757 [Deinococcus xinjiangensis]|uniref:Uncharacterized protein n=1 Tax=Deinococcus xinjiangensis TaxID=457454 RepID=A0ABP9VCP2_9DEIO
MNPTPAPPLTELPLPSAQAPVPKPRSDRTSQKPAPPLPSAVRGPLERF